MNKSSAKTNKVEIQAQCLASQYKVMANRMNKIKWLFIAVQVIPTWNVCPCCFISLPEMCCMYRHWPTWPTLLVTAKVGLQDVCPVRLTFVVETICKTFIHSFNLSFILMNITYYFVYYNLLLAFYGVGYYSTGLYHQYVQAILIVLSESYIINIQSMSIY